VNVLAAAQRHLSANFVGEHGDAWRYEQVVTVAPIRGARDLMSGN
jgi:hypothetical protein